MLVFIREFKVRKSSLKFSQKFLKSVPKTGTIELFGVRKIAKFCPRVNSSPLAVPRWRRITRTTMWRSTSSPRTRRRMTPRKRVGISILRMQFERTQILTKPTVSFDSFPDFNRSDESEDEPLMDVVERNEESNQSGEGQENVQNASNQRRISYDRNLPATHSYLGELSWFALIWL